MCPQTDELKALEGIAAAAALRQTLMAAETASGESVPDAARTLLPHERRAKMRFGEIYQLMNDKTDRILREVDDLSLVARDVIYEGLDGITSRREAIPAMVQLRAKQPDAMIRAEIQAARVITGILMDTYTGASRIAMGEASRQGINLGRRSPLEPGGNEFLPAATALAMVPWTQTLASFQVALFDPTFLEGAPEVSELAARRKKVNAPGEILDMVDAAAAKSAPKAKDAAKQTVHTAHGKGRTRTAQKMKPTLIWASELLDGNTCAKCRRLDGKEYKTLAAGKRDYPNGPYKNCLGGNRCRGTLVFIYDEPEETWL